MSRNLRYRDLPAFSGKSAPGEALALAQAILAEPLPDNRAPRGPAAPVDRELLEWLATVSTEHERQRQTLLRKEALAAEASERDRRRFEWSESIREEWDESKHPRDGGPPNPGWFASTGDSGGSSKSGGPNQPPREQDLLAQAPQPGQPPAQGGQQLPSTASVPHPNRFGTWPERPAGFVPERPRDNGMEFPSSWQVRRAYRTLPPGVRGALDANGVDVSLDKDDREVRADFERRKINMKDGAIGGVYDSGKGVIHVFDTTPRVGGAPPRRLDDPAGSLRHEVGHAMDHHLGEMSQSPGFMQAHAADVAAARNNPKLGADDKHYLSKSREGFAEAFARTLEGGKKPGVLPNSVKYLQQSPDVQRLIVRKPQH